jgi:hypothetical protein
VEERRRRNQLDDENVRLAWMSYEALAAAFEGQVFARGDTARRKQGRDGVFAGFDLAVSVTEAHWAHKYKQEYSLVCPEGGMPRAEKEHRLRDLLASPAGPAEQERVETVSVLELVRARILRKLPEGDPLVASIDGILAGLAVSTDTIQSASIFAKQISKWGETKKAKSVVRVLLRLHVV